MEKTIINLHTGFKVAPVDPRIFGGFLEHMGRAVYEGVYQPASPQSDADGFRQDVLDQLRHLKMTTIRYPGGNFASGYHWQDGVGSRDQRPTLRELAWQSIEPNQFGTDEFMRLCRKMSWLPMLTVNLGTGTPEEARNWVEYCNSPAGTRFADLRAANGSQQPHAVPLWCLGNEMDGPWQLGHVPADQYAIRAQQAAKMMKDTDRTIELVVCGSSGIGLPSYMEWDRQVLDHMGDLTDYISLHRYVGNPNKDTPDYLAITNSIDRQIEEMDSVCRFVQAKHRSQKRAYLCFDEWNVWYKNMQMDGEGKLAPHLIEEVYNLEDALVVAGFLHSFIRHADVVKIANLAQIVNVIAPLLTREQDVLVQSIFHSFAMFSSRRNGISLRCAVDGPNYEGATNGRVHYIDASAILEEDKLHVFLTNRSLDEDADVNIVLADGAILACAGAEILTGPEARSANSFEDPDVVIAKPFEAINISNHQAYCKLPPLAFVAMTLNLE
ncbi:MAG TPA: alpha-L-arabinofuranosidase C-terminal domain-containing protein [Anaerolineales bacterium]|nr:alpha-L-arabinofuranosidase C-terminal domain-containing protein [Anaerolineales bacterium]